ncbi:MAG: hypothetical protein RIC24_04795 [Hyphomicrobiales bacterium]
MTVLRHLLDLRSPLATLALCALLGQQMVGYVLTASPAMALESGFSLCLSAPPGADDDPKDMVSGAGFCPCTLTVSLALLPPSTPLLETPLTSTHGLSFVPQDRLLSDGPPTGPPPARAPPKPLHS